MSDREILADYQSADEVWREKGDSISFYKINGANRIAVWKAAAERGSTKGIILCARCLLEGIGVRKIRPRPSNGIAKGVNSETLWQ